MKKIAYTFLYLLLGCGGTTLQAYADAATHTFELVVAKTYPDSCPSNQQTCGQWACLMKAKLTSLTEASEEVTVMLKFKHPISKEFATVAFSYPPLATGKSEITTGTAYGPICKKLKFREVSAECSASNPPCTGFTLIQTIPPRSPRFPQLPKVKVEVP